ncbi:uncharacterized protein LDX57_006444 [Aspergillus melleus]|uniref:uncharacterized protein n=1 Tax=Aspergillus melleus TaxID=138277 RepID=UPI001E8CA8D4|nr:uncharacterized protein LDX57_006444 [Aspergillus melleus]KAH8428760.1 hypothetical protein LDX57_006444 [Aspergillus melleus]
MRILQGIIYLQLCRPPANYLEILPLNLFFAIVPDPFSALDSPQERSISTSSQTAELNEKNASTSTSTTTPGPIPDWSMEKLRQRGSAPKNQAQQQRTRNETVAWAARSMSRETVTAEDTSLNLFGVSLDGSQLALQLSPDHRVLFK